MVYRLFGALTLAVSSVMWLGDIQPKPLKEALAPKFAVAAQQRTAHGDAAAAVLARARDALGGVARLDAIRTLEVRGTDQRDSERGTLPAEEFRFRALWPENFQITSKWFTHTLNGQAVWFRQTGGPAVHRDATIEATARQSTERDAAILALTFLLKTPPHLKMHARYLGYQSQDGVVGEVVEFATDTGFAMRLILDQGRPSAIVTTVRRIGRDGELTVPRVRRLEDYREVSGIRVPFRIDERSPNVHIVRRIDQVLVDLRLSRSDFVESGR
jgi:hypothetical protein